MRKTRILLNWDTSRKDLLEPFISLKDDLEFIIIWGEDRNNGGVNHPFKQIYFSDFKTPYQLLKKIKPDKILFFNINSFPQIALNLAARNSGIRTYVMHHGIHHSDNLKINIERKKYVKPKEKKLVSNLFSLWFYFSALRMKNINQVFKYFYFAWLRQKNDTLIAMQSCVFEARFPDYYINLSPHNAIITKILDHISSDDKFIYIGHPFFDSIMTRLKSFREKQKDENDKYFLLIDFPNLDHLLYPQLITLEEKVAFYQRLSALAKSMGCRLKVKLHPLGYNSPYNYKDENIDLIYESDIACLIDGAQECFSFFSTLLIPIIYHRRYCYVFQIGGDLQIQKELEELGMVKKLDVNCFSKEDLLNHSENEISSVIYQTFVERYLYYTDGHATERLKNILLD